jgi:hypothetical protein
MPLLGFTKLKEKLLDGSKTQTIRKLRKHPLKVGDILHIYWKLRTKECEKLGDAKITKIVRKDLSELTEEDAIKDGFQKTVFFNARTELINALLELHKKEPNWKATNICPIDVITFEWTERKWLKQ